MTATVAHEVSQPLAAILNNCEATLRWLESRTPDMAAIKTATQRTITQARRATEVICRIRDMAARRQSEREAVFINPLIEEAINFLLPELKRSQVKIRLDLMFGLPEIIGDRIQLQQVIINLALNAAQAMGEDDHPDRRLIVRTRRVDGAAIRIEVQDTGPGISPESRERLFENFFSTKPNGMGLGLAICRSIVQAHGGTICAVNFRKTRGARFTLVLPVASPIDIAPPCSNSHVG